MNRRSEAFAVAGNCQPIPQQVRSGRVKGPDDFAWHLREDFSQIGTARDAIEFSDPRTRIAHIDTRYHREHVAHADHIWRELQRRCETEPQSLADLTNRCHVLEALFDPSREQAAWVGLWMNCSPRGSILAKSVAAVAPTPNRATALFLLRIHSGLPLFCLIESRHVKRRPKFICYSLIGLV
jgi:hypothetical protein